MKISKVAASTARRIFRACSPDGVLDEAKLRTAIGQLVAEKPRDFKGILGALARLVRREQSRKQVLVESARFLDPATESNIRESLTAKYGQGLNFEFRTNPDLLGGLKVRVGDDVIDGSVKSRLERLESAFN